MFIDWKRGRALAPYDARDATQLNFSIGDAIVLHGQRSDTGWQFGQNQSTKEYATGISFTNLVCLVCFY